MTARKMGEWAKGEGMKSERTFHKYILLRTFYELGYEG